MTTGEPRSETESRILMRIKQTLTPQISFRNRSCDRAKLYVKWMFDLFVACSFPPGSFAFVFNFGLHSNFTRFRISFIFTFDGSFPHCPNSNFGILSQMASDEHPLNGRKRKERSEGAIFEEETPKAKRTTRNEEEVIADLDQGVEEEKPKRQPKSHREPKKPNPDLVRALVVESGFIQLSVRIVN